MFMFGKFCIDSPGLLEAHFPLFKSAHSCGNGLEPPA